jgi:FdrA protein
MAVLANQVRHAFYMDSVALMRISRAISSLPGVNAAALMIGSTTNKKLMRDAALLDHNGEAAGPNDLVLAVRADSADTAEGAFKEATRLLEGPTTSTAKTGQWHPKTFDTALQQLPGANLALISVPGEFAAVEARRALNKGLHVMLFSDNVSILDEIALKQVAQRRGLFMMGPDCGTAIIGGVPLGFANAVPRGNTGIVAASGTGLQEISSLIARGGQGISHAIGVGGRDLKEAVGGLMTLLAIDALDRDLGTARIIVISKPPEPAVARRILERVARSKKPFIICFIGADEMSVPANVVLFFDLRSAAQHALGGQRFATSEPVPSPAALARRVAPGRSKVKGFFSGGTLCAEAQVFFHRAGLAVASNVPIPRVSKASADSQEHILLDLGDDEYTVGCPHPMIDPSLRNNMLRQAIADGRTAVALADIVIGYGSHGDPAGELIANLPPPQDRKAVVVTSVCGTEADPQCYSRQVGMLREAGVVVAPSNADAAELAIAILRAIA